MVKKAIIGILLVLLILMVGTYLSLHYFVNKEAIKSQFVSSFKAATGLDVEISGDVVVESFPAPHVVINSIYVHNAPGGLSSFLLSIKLVKIWPTFSSFLRKHMIIGKINIDDMDIELERLKSNQMNWQDSMVQTSAPVSFSSLSGEASGLVGTTITLTNGYVRYVNEIADTSSEYKDINITLLNGGAESESTMKLDFQYRDKALSVSGKIGNIQQALSVGEMPAHLNITSDKSDLTYEGNAGFRGGNFSINGKMKFVTDDIGSWIDTVMSSEKIADNTEKPPESIDKQAENSKKYKLLPLEMKSSITTENGKIIFPDIVLEGAIIKGGMRVAIDSTYDIDIKALINTFNLEALFDSKFFAYKEKVEEQINLGDLFKNEHPAAKEPVLTIAPKTFFDSFSISTDIKLDDALYNDQHIKDSHILFDVTGGEVTISQAAATLPGETRVVFVGLGKQGFQGFTLEGEFDASGADFSEAMKVMKSNGAAIPAQDFKRFRLKANASLSAKELRLSELAMRIENMEFVGGVIATFGDRIKLNAAMRVGGVNLDHFVQIWGVQEWRSSLFDTTPDAKYDSFLASWLRRLDYDAHMNISFERFILNGIPRDKASFKMTATAGKVAFDDIQTAYNGSRISGNFVLDVMGVLPKIIAKMTIDAFDADTFFTPDGKPPQIPPEQANVNPASRWSHQKFDFHWLELVNLTFDLKFGHYKQGLISAQNLHVQGGVEDQALTIDALTGTVLGAQFASRIGLKGGRIPSITIAANITSLDPVQLTPFLPVLKGMTGEYKVSLNLDTNGVDMFSWVSSLEGFIGLGGEHVDIHDFNLAAVIDAVAYVRTVADILNVVRRAFQGGDTMFTNIEGQWAVANGVFKTANCRLTSEQTSGLLTSQVDLVNWQMQAIVSLTFKILNPTHPPGMIITLNGSMDHLDVAMDTRSLEQYVTNKTSQHMLQQYGTH